ncbi:MAG: mechanosensitive ion channel family protein [Syntrophales bacterium]|nr:mechanosensitive ion channel family protein [Syntrophales bacterium]
MSIEDYIRIKSILPFLYTGGGIIIGFILEKFILLKLEKITDKTTPRLNEIILISLKGSTFIFFTILGIYFTAIHYAKGTPYANLIPKILMASLILLVTVVLTKMSIRFVDSYGEKLGKDFFSVSIFSHIIGTVVFLIGLLTLLNLLGISIAPLLTALGIGGLAVALALQDTLANLFAGIHIIMSRQIKPGDFVRLTPGLEGFVQDITWRYCTIRAMQNYMIIVPNAELAKTVLINFNRPEEETNVIVNVGVSYDSDLEKVERVTIEEAEKVMREVPGGVENHTPFIRYHTFGESSIVFSVILKARTYADQFSIKHELIKRLQKRYAQEGITIPFPIRNVYLHSSVDKSEQ